MVSAFIFYSFVCLMLGLKSNFHLLGVPAMNLSYADLRLITTASECLQNSSWSIESASCDPWGRPFNYPTIWVKIFAFLGINEAHTQFIGGLQILILSSAFFYWVWEFRGRNEIKEGIIYLTLIAGFLLSPPILLLMERGNIDTLIFAGLTLAAICLRRQLILISGLILAFLGSLKIYPFVGVYALLKSTMSRTNRILVLTATILGGLFLINEIEFISNRSLTNWNSASYGVSILPLMLMERAGFEESRIVSALLGFIVLLTVSIVMNICISPQFEKRVTLLGKNFKIIGSFNMFVSIFIFSYLLGTSYDYRLVITFPIFIALYSVCETTKERLIILFLMLSIMYGGNLPFKLSAGGMFLNAISDAVLAAFTSVILLILLKLNLGKNVSYK